MTVTGTGAQYFSSDSVDIIPYLATKSPNEAGVRRTSFPQSHCRKNSLRQVLARKFIKTKTSEETSAKKAYTSAEEISYSEKHEISCLKPNDNSNSFNQKDQIENPNQFCYKKWWEDMVYCFNMWSMCRDTCPISQRLQAKHSEPNCKTAYFTGADLTNWLAWYIRENPYKGNHPDVEINGENIVALASILLKEHEISEFDQSSDLYRSFTYYLDKLSTVIHKESVNENVFVDSKYQVYYRICTPFNA